MAGTQRAKIAAEISAIQSEYYGKGPLRSKTYWQDDLICVVLEETFTQAEKTLIRQGEIDHCNGRDHDGETFQADAWREYRTRTGYPRGVAFDHW